MSKFMVTQGWSSLPADAIGTIELSEEAKLLIEENPEQWAFGISFIGEPDENGVYHDAELIGVSLIATNSAIKRMIKK